MKNIYIFDDAFSSAKNGVGAFINSLINCLEDPCIKVHLISLNSEIDDFDIVNEDNITRMLFPICNNVSFTSNPQCLVRLLIRYVEDNLDNVFILNHIPCSELIGLIKDNFPLSKIVFIVHDFFWTSLTLGDYGALKEQISDRDKFYTSYFNDERKTLELADKVVCLSSNAYDLLISTYLIPAEKIKIIANGIEDPLSVVRQQDKYEIRKDFNISDDQTILLYVGRITKSKGFSALIAAFKNILQMRYNVRLVIAGQSFEDMHLPSNISTNITFLGHVPKDDLCKWYTITDIGVIPSYSEQCSYVGIEMLAHSVAIVASDGFGMANMFGSDNSRVTKIIERKNEDIFANNILNEILMQIKNDKLREALSIKARNSFLGRYKLSKMKKSYIDCITRL